MNEKKYDGYISEIQVNGKLYKIGVEVLETRPIICKRCGAPVQLKYGEGYCEYCGTNYTTLFYITEEPEKGSETA